MIYSISVSYKDSSHKLSTFYKNANNIKDFLSYAFKLNVNYATGQSEFTPYR